MAEHKSLWSAVIDPNAPSPIVWPEEFAAMTPDERAERLREIMDSEAFRVAMRVNREVMRLRCGVCKFWCS